MIDRDMRRTNRQRAAECKAEADNCLDLIVWCEMIGFPYSAEIVGHCLRLSEMHAVYMTDPDGTFGDISAQHPLTTGGNRP